MVLVRHGAFARKGLVKQTAGVLRDYGRGAGVHTWRYNSTVHAHEILVIPVYIDC